METRIAQGTDEWLRLRLGKITASRMADVMAKTKSGPSASRKNYMMELICEKLSGESVEFYKNAAMQRGNDLEPVARGAYEADKGLFVVEEGLVDHPQIKGLAASPDGLVGDDGLLEIKCPNTATHLDFLKTSKIPSKYILQMHTQMICTGRNWCDFVSYDDRLQGLEYKCIRVYLDKQIANHIIEEVNLFIENMNDELTEIEKLKEAMK
jgi:putative phage-type endonuclease